MNDAPKWVFDLYDDLLIDLFLDRRPKEEIAAFVSFLEATFSAPHAGLHPRRILDQGCGVGTLAIPLAARGFAVVGVDLIASYTDEAQARAAKIPNLAAAFVAADASTFEPSERFDGAFTVGTCIGHGDDAQTRAIFQAAHNALRPGARYVVEFLGAPGILRNFERQQITRGETRHGGVTLLRNSRLDLAAGVMHKTWTWLLPGGEERVRESAVRFYMPHELVERLTAVGFSIEGLYGDADARNGVRPLGMDDLRCLIVARKS